MLTAGLLGAFACTPGPNPDVDRDGVVGPLDLARVEACVGTNPAADPGCATSDVDRDGDVDAADLALVTEHLDSDGDGSSARSTTSTRRRAPRSQASSRS